MMIVTSPSPPVTQKRDRETARIMMQVLTEMRLLRHGLVLSDIAVNLDEPIFDQAVEEEIKGE